MSKDQNKYRLKLEGQQRILQDVQSSGEEAAKTVELDQTRVGRLSRMDAMQAQAISIATNSRRKTELQRIAAALHRIEMTTSGSSDDMESDARTRSSGSTRTGSAR